METNEVAVHEIPDDATLLDVREEGEWHAGHAPEAIHVPLTTLAGRIDDVPDTEPLYVICKVGGRSAQAVAWLNSLGRQAVNVTGGMESWHAAGRSMTSETGREPFVA